MREHVDPADVPAGATRRHATDPNAGAADDARGATSAITFRTLWISDLHLGTPGCDVQALLTFLRQVECETLYLVGDILDGWQLKRHWYWPQAHNDVIQKLLRKARKGTRIIFIPGNHDEFARAFVNHEFGGIEILQDHMHITADGRRLWVTHGDMFDGVVQCARWLAHAGDVAYEFSLKINRWLDHARAACGLPYWSLSQFLKHRVKGAVSYVNDFERAVVREAGRRGADGVVCGHIHHATIRTIDGLLYCNDGDWVESLTALAEHVDGRLELLDFSRLRSIAPRSNRLARPALARENAEAPGPSAPALLAQWLVRDKSRPEQTR